MADMPDQHKPEEYESEDESNNRSTTLANEQNGVLENIVEQYSQECTALNSTMEEIDSWMTSIEKQNDDLFSKLKDLLESSRQTRQELQEGRSNNPDDIQPTDS